MPGPAKIRIGIGGWTFAPWRDNFYPAGLPHAQELAFAGKAMSAIEINGTFYRHQTPASFAAWANAVPPDFVFTVKAHRATTHAKDLTQAGPSIDRFVASGLAELGPKLGPILWQFAPTKKFDPAQMQAFLAALPRRTGGLDLRHAVEARHPTFLDPQWPILAAQHHVAIAIVDSDKQALRGDVTADFIYARLQRNQDAAPEGYPPDALDSWADRLGHWSTGQDVTDLERYAPPKPAPRECFCFFISGDKARAPQAAMAMQGRLGKEAVLF